MDNAGSVAGSAARTATRLVKIQPNLYRARLPASSPSLDAGQAGSLRSRRLLRSRRACAPGEAALPADAKEQRATAKFIFSSSARSSLKFSNNLPAFCGKVSRNCVVLLTKIA